MPPGRAAPRLPAPCAPPRRAQDHLPSVVNAVRLLGHLAEGSLHAGGSQPALALDPGMQAGMLSALEGLQGTTRE